MTVAAVDLAAGFTIASYALTGRVLGRGGFGTVYEARHTQLDRLAAIKVQGGEAHVAGANARLLEEARLIARLRHPNIVDVFDVGALDDGRVYFVMELLDGVTLDQHLAASGRLAIGAALPILRELARAVDAIHAKGFTHRDLKPSNVMLLREDDGSLRVKLLDFGIAKALDAQRGDTATTAPGMLVGTPEYMSPEQCLVDPVGPASDIYSLGVITYRVLTGERLFTGPAIDIYHAHVHAPPPKPSRSGSAAELDAPILAMLAKSPEARPRSAIAAIDALAARTPATTDAPTVRAEGVVVRRPRSTTLIIGGAVSLAVIAAVVVVVALSGRTTPEPRVEAERPALRSEHVVPPDAAVGLAPLSDASVEHAAPRELDKHEPITHSKNPKDELEDLPPAYRP